MWSRRPAQTLAILIGYGIGAAALYRGMPEQTPPSWTSGSVTIWLGNPLVAFLLPTAAIVTRKVVHVIAERHPVDPACAASVAAINDAIMLRVIVFLMAVHATVLAGVLGVLRGHAWAAELVPVMMGLTMISVGNLLPRTRPNLAIGVRTARTLADRALWIRTHRSIGYVVMALGLVIVCAAIMLPKPLGTGMILLAGPIALFCGAFVALDAWR